MEDVGRDTCFGPGSVAGAVIGTFLTTILLLAVAALLYRQWRRHKGKHLVLVTDPEIVEDAYAFDNPCFKDATPAVGRVHERPLSAITVDTPAKDSTRWSTPWTTLGLGSANRSDKRRTLDDSCLGPKATRVNVVSLRSHDFTGLGFNVCGNMREGIFVKDLLHRGPASESGRIHPGDRIASVKISFRNMVYEDALTILSYASPYDVELEVENGGAGSKPTTLLKKTVGPSQSRICHPLYRSQSIPELSQAHKNVAKRLFIADPNESVGSNHSTLNSTLKSSKSTPGSQTLERRHEEGKNNHHHKFGIKVLPALDGTVHRIENQNEHNTNLERRHSKKIDAEKYLANTNKTSTAVNDVHEDTKPSSASLQKTENPRQSPVRSQKRPQVENMEMNGIDVPDEGKKSEETVNIPCEVPAEVHNAAMAARRNRKNSSELLASQKLAAAEQTEPEGPKSPQKNKRKAPAPPKSNSTEPEGPTPTKQLTSRSYDLDREDTIDSISDYTESLNEYVNKVRETADDVDARRQRLENQRIARRNSESDTDSEIQNSFTTIELNPSDITIHRTPVPETNDDEDDMYRKAASLGDLSKYESKTSATLERAQSLDMTDTGSKKRKAPLPPPEDITESTEDLTKLDQIDTFDRRKLKKSSEWGTLEDAIWANNGEPEDRAMKAPTRKKSNGTLERSKSAVEIKLKGEAPQTDNSEKSDDMDDKSETSIELYNLPLSKKLTQEFIRAERLFEPDKDNSLARIVNDGRVVKSPTFEEVELDFRQAVPLPDEDTNDVPMDDEIMLEDRENPVNEEFSRALRYFEMHSGKSPTFNDVKLNLTRLDEANDGMESSLYTGRKAVVEEPMRKVTVDRRCRGCEERHEHHDEHCEKHSTEQGKHQHRGKMLTLEQDGPERENSPLNKRQRFESTQSSKPLNLEDDRHDSLSQNSAIKVPEPRYSEGNTEDKDNATFQARRTKFETKRSDTREVSPVKSNSGFEGTFAKRVISVSNSKSLHSELDDEEDEDEYEFGSGVTVNNKNLSTPSDERHNISNVSVSSGENSEDSGLVRESMDYTPQDSEKRPPLPSTPMPHKMTYITEIKVSPTRERVREENEDIAESNGPTRKSAQNEMTVTSNGKATPGKKPPVPPRRSDISKSLKNDQTEKQVVYVSEYKSPPSKDSQASEPVPLEIRQTEMTSKKFEHWIFLNENKEQNPWGNGSSQPQPVTNIMLSSGDEKIVQQ